MSTSQLVIIGAGPGGYTAAFHAADLGLSVTLIHNEPMLGGVCLNRGCIPSKALLHAAGIMTETSHARAIGIEIDGARVNAEKLRSWKEGVVTKLTGGLAQLAKARKITCIQGEAEFLNATTLKIKKSDGTTEQLSFDHAIIATGSRPVSLPCLPKSTRVWDSTTALGLPFIPKTLLVIGGRYIGLELGTAYAGLGSEVTVVEAVPQLLSGADRDLADMVLRSIKKSFAGVLAETKVISGKEVPDGIEVVLESRDGKQTTRVFDAVLAAVGRKPNTDGIGLETTRIQVNDKGFIDVKDTRQTDEKNIFAIGDVTGDPMLAHKASCEAKIAVQVIAGKSAAYEPKAMPAVVFTNPELAWVGLTEAEAKDNNIDIAVFKFPWAASGRALTLDRTDGITKIMADASSGRILGVGIAGVGAGDLIAEGALAVETGMKAEDLSLTVHPHPTLSETLMETAEGLFGNPVHLLKSKK